MSDGRYIKRHSVQADGPSKLALAELRSVQWLRNQRVVMNGQRAIAKRYNYFRKILFVGWGLLLMEIIVVWWWTFIHNISWPRFVLSIIDRLDSVFVYILEMVQRRLDWWWDIAGVRLMWFRESTENFLDRNLTVIDHYFAIGQDWVSGLFSFVSKPIRAIGSGASGFISQKPATRAPSVKQRNNGALRRNSEGYEAEDNEDFGDEDYLSDASMDSRRLMKENSRGESYMRHHTTAMAGGKFREAMYHRVRNELGVMRKNSIRLSTDIVNCARQMVALHTRQYGESFLEFCQRWARERGLLDLIQTARDEMKGQHFLVKPLVLVRVLSEAWLAFLLRLVKGKRSRRTRSMRSESLRRRVLNQGGMSNPLQLSPAALQQSSEPVQHHHLPVQPTLQRAALKEEEEDLEGFLSKDSALGSEDNRSETVESDQTLSRVDEVLESDSDMEQHQWNSYSESEAVQETPQGDPGEVQERSFTPYSNGGSKFSSTLCNGSQKSSTLCAGSERSSTSCIGSERSSTLSTDSERSSTPCTGSERSSTSCIGSERSSTSCTGSEGSSALSTGSERSSISCTGSERSSTLSTGSEISYTLSTGGQKSSTLCTGSERTSTLCTGSERSTNFPTGSDISSTLSTGSQKSSTPCTGSKLGPNNFSAGNGKSLPVSLNNSSVAVSSSSGMLIKNSQAKKTKSSKQKRVTIQQT